MVPDSSTQQHCTRQRVYEVGVGALAHQGCSEQDPAAAVVAQRGCRGTQTETSSTLYLVEGVRQVEFCQQYNQVSTHDLSEEPAPPTGMSQRTQCPSTETENDVTHAGHPQELLSTRPKRLVKMLNSQFVVVLSASLRITALRTERLAAW